VSQWTAVRSPITTVGLVLALGAFVGLPGRARAASARDGMACLERTDLDCAVSLRDRLVADDGDDPEVIALDARTLFYEGRYDEAVAQLDRLTDVPELLARDPIRETAEAAAGFVEADGEGVRVRYLPGVDLVLQDEALDVLQQSRRTVDGLLGGGPDHDILVDIFPDGRRFIAASGLPPEAVRTTGVIALSKWTRLLLTSPRALARGYSWKDTIAHEYIHLVVAWRTQDRCPVWLQEGLAKHLEGYWRGKTDGMLGAHQQSMLAHALRDDSFVPFEKFQHSMAYLDSGEEAALAFAQVSTMVQFLVDRQGIGVLPGVLDAIRDGQSAEQAVAEAAGVSDFDSFRQQWRAWVATLPLVQEQLAALPVVLDQPGDEFSEDPLLAGRPELARYARIGDLLREAGKHEAALIEYTKASDDTGPESPLLLARKAVCHEALGQKSKALAVARQAVELYPEFTLAQTTLARLLDGEGRTRQAVASWEAAHDLNPFDPSVQRALVDDYTALGNRALADRHRRYARILATGGALSADRALQTAPDTSPPHPTKQ